MGQFKIIIEYLPDNYSILQNKIAIQTIITEECVKGSAIDILEYSAKRSIQQFVREFECEVDNLRYNPNRNSSMKSTYDHNYGNRYA
jgi:hypothetical protein